MYGLSGNGIYTDPRSPSDITHKEKLVWAYTDKIQKLLIAMYPSLRSRQGAAITDGRFGSKTALYWKAFAELYALNPYIAKRSSDGRQVIVDQNTLWMARAIAEATQKQESYRSYGLSELSGESGGCGWGTSCFTIVGLAASLFFLSISASRGGDKW